MTLAVALSEDYVMDTPLPQLLAELHAELVEVPTGDAAFCGQVEVHGEQIKLSVSSRWSEIVQDGMARALLGFALRVPLPPLPAPFAVSES